MPAAIAEAASDVTLSAAALMLARGDGAGASRLLEHRWRTLAKHRVRQATALDVLVDAHLAAGDVAAAAAADVPPGGDRRFGGRRSSPRSPQRPVVGSPPPLATPASAVDHPGGCGLAASPTSGCRSRRPAPTTRSPDVLADSLPGWPSAHARAALDGFAGSAPPSTPTESPPSSALTASPRGPARRGSARLPPESRKCCACSPMACPTRRSPAASTSAARRPPTTSAASSPSSTCANRAAAAAYARDVLA